MHDYISLAYVTFAIHVLYFMMYDILQYILLYILHCVAYGITRHSTVYSALHRRYITHTTYCESTFLVTDYRLHAAHSLLQHIACSMRRIAITLCILHMITYGIAHVTYNAYYTNRDIHCYVSFLTSSSIGPQHQPVL